MCAYSVFNTFPVYPLSAKPLILLAFCRYRYHTSLFVAAVKYDLYNETLSFTMIDGQNPFAEGKTQLQLIRCPDP